MKTVRLILMLFILPVCALAQGAQYTGIAQTARNMIGMGNVYVPIPGASVNVCTGVYTGTACPSGGNVTVYSNQALTTALTQPLTADNYGNFTFWAAPGAYYFTVTGQGAASSSYQLTLPFGISGTYNAVAKSIEQVRYADQHDFSPLSPQSPLASGVLDTITLPASIPDGVTSGAVSIVSISSASTTMTWVAGDKFNTAWANKTVNLDDSYLTVASCASATTCTLSANAPRTSSYSWAIVGTPDSIYVSGGTGAAEAVDVTGVGTECPSGTATSICFTPANAHSGAYTVQSATGGIQEAINVIEAAVGFSANAAGRVVIPTGPRTLYSPVWIARNGVEIGSNSVYAPALSYSGPGSGLAGAINVVNAGYVQVDNLSVAGSGASQNLHGLTFMCTSGSGGCANDTVRDVAVSGFGGAAKDQAGASVNAGGVYVDSVDGMRLVRNYSTYNQDALLAETHGGGSGLTVSQGDYSFAYANGIDLAGSWTGVTVGGNRVFDNAGHGLTSGAGGGLTIIGNHFEANHDTVYFSGQSMGVSIIANTLSQHPDSGATCLICGAPPKPLIGLDVNGNYFDLNQGGGAFGMTSLIDVACDSCDIGKNTLDAFLTGNNTLTNYVTFPSGSTKSVVEPFELGPNATLSGYALAVVNEVNDQQNSFTAPNGEGYRQLWGGYSTLLAGGAGLLVTGETSATNNILQIAEGSGTATIGAYGLRNFMSFSFSVPYTITTFQPLALAGGGSVPVSQTLTNAGTVNGAGTFDFSAGTLKQPSTYTVGANTINNPSSAGTLAITAQLPLSGSVAGSTTSLAANTCGDVVTQTVTGAATTMTPVVTVDGALPTSGLVIQAAVTSANTVSIEYCNVTTGSVVPAAATLEIRVIQ